MKNTQYISTWRSVCYLKSLCISLTKAVSQLADFQKNVIFFYHKSSVSRNLMVWWCLFVHWKLFCLYFLDHFFFFLNRKQSWKDPRQRVCFRLTYRSIHSSMSYLFLWYRNSLVYWDYPTYYSCTQPAW